MRAPTVVPGKGLYNTGEGSLTILVLKMIDPCLSGYMRVLMNSHLKIVGVDCA